MSERRWSVAPIPLTTSSIFEEKLQRDQMKLVNEQMAEIPFAKNMPAYGTAIDAPMVFQDMDTGEYVKGMLEYGEASRQQLKGDYARGFLATDAGFRQQFSTQVVGGRDLSLYNVDPEKLDLLEIPSHVSEQLLSGMKGPQYNLALWDYRHAHDVPIIDLFASGPEDFLNMEPPEGWSTKAAINEFKERDPKLYSLMATTLGGDAGIEEITRDSRNPVEFFYDLNRRQQLLAITQSQQMFEDRAGFISSNYEGLKNFVVNGILDDPDMAASFALSVGLAAFTAGTSLLAGAAFKIGKAAKTAHKFTKILGSGRAVGRGLAISAKHARTAQVLLPENLGPTLVRTVLFKEKYAKMGGVAKFGVNRLSDSVEGTISGALAETFNQKRKKDLGLIDEMSYAAIASEALTEAALSPLINPIFGGVFKGIGMVASVPGTIMSQAFANTLGKRELGKYLQETTQTALSMFNPQAMLDSMDVYEGKETLITNINSLLGEEESLKDGLELESTLIPILETVRATSGLDSPKFLDALNVAVENIITARSASQGTNKEMTGAELGVSIITQLATENAEMAATLGEKGFEHMMAVISNQLTMITNAKKEGLSVEEYFSKVVEDGTYFDLLPEVLKQEVYKKAGGEEAAKKLGDTKLREIAAEVQLDIIKESKKIHSEFKKRVESTKKEVNEVNESVQNISEATGIPIPPRVDPSPEPTVTSRPKSNEGATDAAPTEEQGSDEAQAPVDDLTEQHRKETDLTETQKELINIKEELMKRRRDARNAETVDRKELKEIDKNIKSVDALLTRIETLRKEVTNSINAYLTESGQSKELIELGRTLRKLTEQIDRAMEKLKPMQNEINQNLEDRSTLSAIFTYFGPDSAEKYPDGVFFENLSPELQETLQRIHDSLKSGTAKTYLAEVIAGKKLSVKEIKSRIVKTLQRKTEQLKEKWENDALVDHIRDEEKKLEELRGKYNVENAKYQQENIKKDLIQMTQVISIAEVAKRKKDEIRSLETRRRSIDELMADKDTVSIQEVYVRLPRKSMLRGELKARLKDTDGDGTITVDELNERLDDDFADSRKKIVSTIGTDTRYSPMSRTRQTKRISAMYGNRYAHEISDGEIYDVDFDIDWLVENNTPGTALRDVKISVEEDHKSFKQWLANLSVVGQTAGNLSEDGTISTWRLLSNMPDYFWDLGLPIHIIFRKAMVNPTENAGSETNSTGSEENPWDSVSNLSSVRWRYSEIVSILERWEVISKTRLTGYMESFGKELAKEMAKDLLSESNPSGLTNLEATAEYLNEAIVAERNFNTEKFNESGYILNIDKATGFPTEFASADQGYLYEAGVRNAIRTRVGYMMNNAKFRLFIKEKAGIEIFLTKPGETAEEAQARSVQEIDTITEYIINNLSLVLNEVDATHPQFINFTLTGFGDGSISWSPAQMAGYAIVDTFVEKSVPMKSRLTGIQEATEYANTEEMRITGESVMLEMPREGDINFAAPISLADNRLNVENYKFRLRIKEVLKKAKSGVPLTPKEKKVLYNSIQSRRFKDETDPVADEMDMYLVPQIVGGHAQEEFITRDQAKEFMMELFLDMAQIGHAINQDSMTIANGGSLRFRNTKENPMPLAFANLNLGYDNITPLGSQLAETLALEQMHPDLSGMSEAAATMHIKFVSEFKSKWQAANPDKEWSASVMLDPSNHTDQVASGLMIVQLLSKLGSGEAAVELDKIRLMIDDIDFDLLNEDGTAQRNSDGTFVSLALEDVYVETGLNILGHIKDKDKDNKYIQGSGKWLTDVFGWLDQNEITNKDNYREKMAEFEASGDTESVRKGKAIREFFKVPVMRRLYGGGLDSFKLEFMGMTANSREIIDELNGAFGIKLTDAETENLGTVLLSASAMNGVHILDAALGFEGKIRDAAMAFLQVGREQQVETEMWRDVVRSSNIPNQDSGNSQGPTELAPVDGESMHIMNRLDRVKRALEGKIRYLAERTPEGATPENIAKIKKKYDNRYGEALRYIEELESKGITIEDKSPHWERLQEILHGGEVGSWARISLFRATNILNATTYKPNMKRMKATADMFGFEDFEPSDWMGLEDHLLYHLSLPTQRSPRSFHKGKHDPHGIFANRVAIQPEQLNEFMAIAEQNAIDDHGEFNQADFDEALASFLTNEEPDAFGMFDIEDNVYKGMSREEVDAELDRLMDMDQLMYMASVDKLPSEIFPDFVSDESDVVVMDTMLREHYEHNRRRFETPSGEKDRTLATEIAREERLLDLGDSGLTILKYRAKIAGGVRSPRVARVLGKPLIPYHRRELSMQEAIGTRDNQDLYMSTVEPQGLLSMTPRYRRSSFFSRGIPVLQRSAVQRKINEVLEPVLAIDPKIQDPKMKGVSVFDTPTGKGLLGWHQPYQRSSLPKAMPLKIDEMIDLGMDDEAGRKAARILNGMRQWASYRDDVGDDLDNPDGLLYWYVVREIERSRAEMLENLPDYSRFSKNEQEKKAHARKYRMQWLEGLHAITHFSRDIKGAESKGMTLADKARTLAVQAADDFDSPESKQRWIDVLTTTITEDNPHGTFLSAPTKLQKSLEFIIPRENVVLMDRIKGVLEDPTATLSTNDLQMLAQMIQSTDFPYHLLTIMYKNEVLPNVLKEFTVTDENGVTSKPYADLEYDVIGEDGSPTGEKAKVWANPNMWENYIQAEHVHAIIANAKVWIEENGADQIIFDTLIEEQLSSNEAQAKRGIKDFAVYLENTNPDIVGDARPAQMRSSFFPEQVLTPTGLVGKGQLALSPAKAMELFGLLESFSLLEKIKRSNWSGQAIGFVKDPVTGKITESKPTSRRIKDGLGHNENDIRKAEVLRSSALERVVGLGGKADVLMATDTTRSVESTGQIEAIDLDSYRRAQHRDDVSAAWMESYISPVSKQLGYMKSTNIDQVFGPSLREELELIIDRARTENTLAKKGEGGLYSNTVMWLAIMLELPPHDVNTLNPRGHLYDTFIGERFSEETNAKAFATAQKLMRQIKQIGSVDGFYYGLERQAPLISTIREWASNDNFAEAVQRDIDIENKSAVSNFLNWLQSNKTTKELQFLGFAEDENGNLVYKKTSRDPELDPLKELEFIINFGLGQERLMVEQDESLMLFGDQESKLNTTGRDLIKLVSKQGKFDDAVRDTQDPHLIRVNNELNNMKDSMTPANFQRFRALIARMYMINPLNLMDLSLDYQNTRGSSFVTRDKEGNFVIRMGGKLAKPMSDPNIALTFAHELSHMGRMRWIEDNQGTWRHWVDLYHSKAGRSLLRKIVTAWHGGNYTAQAKQEFESYMENPEEFISALTSYYLMNDSLPEMNLDYNEGEISGIAGGIVGKIMDFVRRIFMRTSSVLTNFHYQDPRLSQHVENLVQKTLGWDPMAKKSFTEVQNKGTERKMFWDKRFENTTPELENDPTQFKQMVIEHNKLLNLGEEGRTPEEANRFWVLDSAINDSTDATHVMTSGITRYDHIVAHQQNMAMFGGINGTLDIGKMLNSMDNMEGDAVSIIQYSSALEYCMEACNREFGDQFQDGVGLTASKVTKALSNILPSLSTSKHRGEGAYSHMLVDLTVGKAGANYTWNGPHPFVILLTQLINDDIATSTGQYTNVKGTPSVVRVINDIALYKDSVTSSMAAIGTTLQPFFTRALGQQVSTEKQREIMSAVYEQVAIKSDNPSHEVTLPALQESAMSEEDLKIIHTEITNTADNIRLFMEDYRQAGTELGLFKSTSFRTHIPFKLNRLILESEPRDGFVESMSKMIRDKIMGEAEGKLDPLVMFAANLIPRFNTTQNLLDDLKKLKRISPEMYGYILHKAAEAHYTQNGKMDESFDTIRGMRQVIFTDLDSSTDPQRQANAVELFRIGIVSAMNEMSQGRTTAGSLQEFGVNWNNLKDIYITAIDQRIDGERFNTLDSPALDSLIPDHIYYSPKHGQRKRQVFENIDTPVMVHIHNLINRASDGMYFPYDMWSFPSVVEAFQDPAIRPHLNLDPDQMMGDMMKGKGDQLFETQMMVDHFGVFGNVKDLINLFEIVGTRGHGFRNLDGTSVSLGVQKEMIDAASQLRGKHAVTRGINYVADSPSAFESMLTNAAPGLTRTVFGGNLALATFTVETLASTMIELVGRGNFMGSVRSLLSPILGVSPELQKRVGRDLVHTVEALSKGFIPDHEMPANADTEQMLAKIFNFTGRQAMRPAQYMLKSLAIQRAISARNFVVDNLKHNMTKDDSGRPISRLHRLAQLIHQEPLGKDPKAILDRMRRAGFSVFMDGDIQLITSLLTAGLLDIESGSFGILASMVEENTEVEAYYSPGEMLASLARSDIRPSSTEGGRGVYQARKEVIAGLRMVEKQYIEQVLVAPNAFDVFTPKVSSTGEAEGTGALDTLFEIFRRYPMLFVSQHVYRKMNRQSPMKYAFGLTSMLMLDVVYMLALRLSMGAEPEDILEEFEDNPVGFSIGYGVRLPILGRYMGLIGEAIAALPMLAQGKSIRQPGGFIPLGALEAAAKGVLRAGDSVWNNEPHKLQDVLNAMRVVPIVGDRLLALGYYTAAGDGIQRRSNKSSGTGTSRNAETGELQTRHHYGVPEQAFEINEAMNHRVLLEQFGAQMEWPGYSEPKDVPFAGMTRQQYPEDTVEAAPTAPAPTPAPPSEPAPAPAPAPQAEPTMVDRIRGQEGSSGKLADALG